MQSRPAAQIALAWVIHHPAVVAIPGASSVGQMESNAAAADIALTRDQYQALQAASARFRPACPTNRPDPPSHTQTADPRHERMRCGRRVGDELFVAGRAPSPAGAQRGALSSCSATSPLDADASASPCRWTIFHSLPSRRKMVVTRST